MKSGRSYTFGLAAAVTSLTLIVAAIVAGCGKESSDQSVVVPPPDTVSPQNGSANPAAPPGGIELPEDVDLEQGSKSQDEATSSPGLEMPSDLVPPTQSTPSDQSSIPASDANIRYASWTEIQKAAKSTGKVTVVDLWSLVCEPCLKEFPGLVRLHRDLGSQVQCIAVDVDYDGRKTRPPETYEDRVVAFLDSVGADFPTYISRTPSDEVFAATSLASIPAVMVFDADGKLVRVFEDAGDTVGFTYEKDIIPLVTKLTS